MTTNYDEEAFRIGEVNAKGGAALTDWLRDNLADPDYAEAWAAHMIDEFDGSFADLQGLSVELCRSKSKTGNPAVYRFSPNEFDIVTYNEDGELIAKN